MAYKLIIAHASPSIQKALQMAFPASEFEVSFFEDGTETIKALSQLKPDAVLLNLSLPQKDGYEVGRFLNGRQEFKQTSLFLFKGAFELLDAEKMTGLEYDEIVEEPFDSEKLARIVRDTIEGKKDPQTLPEEPPLDETHTDQHESEPKRGELAKEKPSSDSQQENQQRSSLAEETEADIEEKLRDIVRQEILDAERELEKRLKTELISETKERIERELDKIRKLLKKAGD